MRMRQRYFYLLQGRFLRLRGINHRFTGLRLDGINRIHPGQERLYTRGNLGPVCLAGRLQHRLSKRYPQVVGQPYDLFEG